MPNDKEFKEKLNGCPIEGDIAELYKLIYSSVLVRIALDELISVLSTDKTNFIRIACGPTLTQVYKKESAKGGTCKLVFIYFSMNGMTFKEIYKFIGSLGDDIIFGYAQDETMMSGIRLVMIFN